MKPEEAAARGMGKFAWCGVCHHPHATRGEFLGPCFTCDCTNTAKYRPRKKKGS